MPRVLVPVVTVPGVLVLRVLISGGACAGGPCAGDACVGDTFVGSIGAVKPSGIQLQSFQIEPGALIVSRTTLANPGVKLRGLGVIDCCLRLSIGLIFTLIDSVSC